MPDIGSNRYTQGRLGLNGYTTSSIERNGDQDWFRVYLNRGQRVRFDLEGRPTGRGTLSDTYLRGIYNSGGSRLSGTTNDDGGTSTNSRVDFTASSSGYYYVSAGAYGSNTGTYRLTATALNSVSNSSSNGSESENGEVIYERPILSASNGPVSLPPTIPDLGNTLSAACDFGSLSSAQPINIEGSIGGSDSNDYLRFTTTSAARFNLDLTGLSSNANVQLLDNNGDLVDDSTAWFSSPESISISNLAAGTYGVRVYPSFLGGSTNYRLDISSDAPPDTVAPVLTSYSPNNGTTNVARGADITLTFDEQVRPGIGDRRIVISNLTQGGNRTIRVDDSRVSFSDNTVTIDPGGVLAAGCEMQVTMEAGAVQDIAGNAYEGLSSRQLIFVTEGERPDVGPIPVASPVGNNTISQGYNTTYGHLEKYDFRQ